MRGAFTYPDMPGLHGISTRMNCAFTSNANE
jgi:hypothetical protein